MNLQSLRALCLRTSSFGLVWAATAHTAGALQKDVPPAKSPSVERADQPTTPTKPAAAAAQAKPGRASAKAFPPHALDARFMELDAQMRATIPAYNQQLQEAQQKQLPAEQMPASPVKVFYERFEALALQGQPSALQWCLGALSSLGLAPDVVAARKKALYERCITDHAGDALAPLVARYLQSEDVPGGLGLETALALLQRLHDASESPTTRAAALGARATLFARSALPDRDERARAVWKVLAETHPDSPAGQAARNTLFRLDHLSVGKTAPDFTTTDVDGREFKLSDSRGKVTVVVFFGFWCPPCVRMIPHEKALVERLKDRPFALIGIDTDTDKELFRRKAAEMGVTWPVSWQGGGDGPLVRAWGVESFPTIYVLDEKGVIRHIGLRGEALDSAVDALLAALPDPKSAR